MPEDQNFMISTILSHRDHAGRVNLAFNGKPLTQFDLDTARQFAYSLLEAAEAAEQDAMVWQFFRHELHTSEEKSTAAIGLLRKFRGGLKQ